jgi:hypothetical protein
MQRIMKTALIALLLAASAMAKPATPVVSEGETVAFDLNVGPVDVFVLFEAVESRRDYAGAMVSRADAARELGWCSEAPPNDAPCDQAFERKCVSRGKTKTDPNGTPLCDAGVPAEDPGCIAEMKRQGACPEGAVPDPSEAAAYVETVLLKQVLSMSDYGRSLNFEDSRRPFKETP